ncbi:hypothetical protein RDI58_012852 [Solanum bulbocastanum]|uniref:Uncharacterized protein n=1 Tax=Solanum bulbocastanum TaxID=147425 RepID=A0AAN8TQI4_SOLBU
MSSSNSKSVGQSNNIHLSDILTFQNSYSHVVATPEKLDPSGLVTSTALVRPSLLDSTSNSIVSEDFHSIFDGDTVEFEIEFGNDGRTKVVDVTDPDGASFLGVATT